MAIAMPRPANTRYSCHSAVTRDGTARVLGLLGVNGRRLEADEAGEGRGEAGADAVVQQASRGKGVEGNLAARRMDQLHHRVHQGDGDLGHQQHGQDAAVDVHVQHAEHGNHRPGDERPNPPLHVVAESVFDQAAQHGAEPAVQPDLHGVVAEQRHERRLDAGDAPQPLRNVGVERATVHDLSTHGGIADEEDGQHQRNRYVPDGYAEMQWCQGRLVVRF
jgi:hypothetical protein